MQFIWRWWIWWHISSTSHNVRDSKTMDMSSLNLFYYGLSECPLVYYVSLLIYALGNVLPYLAPTIQMIVVIIIIYSQLSNICVIIYVSTCLRQVSSSTEQYHFVQDSFFISPLMPYRYTVNITVIYHHDQSCQWHQDRQNIRIISNSDVIWP